MIGKMASVAAVAVTMLLAAPIARAEGGGAKGVLHIGAFLSLTGQMSLMGEPERKALEMLVEQANTGGGILGRRLKLTVYDDSSDPDKASSAVKRLIENDRADVLIGGSGTPTSMAVLNVVEKAEIPYLSLGGGIGIVEPVRKWTFKVPHTDRMAAEKVLIDIQRRGFTRMALLSENVGFGRSGRDQVLKLAPHYGIEIAADESYGPRDPDVTAQLTKIRSTKGIEVLFVFGTGQGPAVVTRNVRQLGIAFPVYQSHGVASKEFLRLVGRSADGMRLPAAGMAVPDQVRAGDPQKPVVMAFKQAYEARWTEDVTMFAGHAYDAFQIAMDAIGRAGSLDKARVRDEIEATTGFVGTGGIVTMSPGDHLGLTLDAFHMVEVTNGDWVLVD